MPRVKDHSVWKWYVSFKTKHDLNLPNIQIEVSFTIKNTVFTIPRDLVQSTLWSELKSIIGCTNRIIVINRSELL